MSRQLAWSQDEYTGFYTHCKWNFDWVFYPLASSSDKPKKKSTKPEGGACLKGLDADNN
jgi:hypothetical protein